MAHLHELLAVEKDLEQATSKVVSEALVTFTKKIDHFTGHVKTLRMFDEKRAQEEAGQGEVKEITTTVPEKLEYVGGHLARYLDAISQKEATNQQAQGDIELEGLGIITGLPATLLLSLESKLTKIREMYDSIPTLQPGVEWAPDPEASMKGVYKASKDVVNHKTEKNFDFRVLVPATDKHPAQIERWNVDIPVGEYHISRVSGMLTPRQKSTLLGRLDGLISAIKQARQRANNQEVKKLDIGKRLVDFLHKDL